MPGVRLWGYRVALKINAPKYPITVVVICNENWRPRVHVEVENEYAGGKKKPLAWHLGTTTMLCDRPTGMGIQRFIFSLIIDHTFFFVLKTTAFPFSDIVPLFGMGFNVNNIWSQFTAKRKKKNSQTLDCTSCVWPFQNVFHQIFKSTIIWADF